MYFSWNTIRLKSRLLLELPDEGLQFEADWCALTFNKDTEDGFVSQLKALWEIRLSWLGLSLSLLETKESASSTLHTFPHTSRWAWRLLGAPSNVLVNRGIHHLVGCVSILKLKWWVTHWDPKSSTELTLTSVSLRPASSATKVAHLEVISRHQHPLPKHKLTPLWTWCLLSINIYFFF